MGLRFILMLTRQDQTVASAAELLDVALSMGVRHIGFKDVGLPISKLVDLSRRIKKGGATSYLEVVSLDLESEVSSAKAAVELGVDVLLGGIHAEGVLPVIKGKDIKYFPFPGKVSGHPSILGGDIEEITASAKALANKEGVHGLDLLAYRSRENVPQLMKAVCSSTHKPVIVAGSIDSVDQIEEVKEAGALGFTIGTAALDGAYDKQRPDFKSQLRSIMRDVAAINKHLSPFHAQNLVSSFDSFNEVWSPRVAGQINNMQIKLAKFAGDFVWHFHQSEDELFLVHRGRMLMKLRDRDEIVEEGEFVIVPHGVEHCPTALTDACEVILLGLDTIKQAGDKATERLSC